jgi:hypothetical protein
MLKYLLLQGVYKYAGGVRVARDHKLVVSAFELTLLFGILSKIFIYQIYQQLSICWL